MKKEESDYETCMVKLDRLMRMTSAAEQSMRAYAQEPARALMLEMRKEIDELLKLVEK